MIFFMPSDGDSESSCYCNPNMASRKPRVGTEGVVPDVVVGFDLEERTWIFQSSPKLAHRPNDYCDQGNEDEDLYRSNTPTTGR